ncbi:MAG: hypothetical protein A2977_03530 [Alphaproteobacteria bacterium RIFCSPLOWO2_01_FULL_45_8]|nr:MAG: hypothetical protein A3K20_00410 [Alphaproteobacteria bacterium GWA1_45_9]OFW89715.1 MAG: hypothetical protein A2621_02300 [Alphaproteobacteria bacterium RIFCSPHIGHO2_01_FULL_41_14]OFW96104.1 MAG: hypothetical protein A2977_03530 [Alphaproteobacteria bacterium RIFCSPLOWO2_01_FULL_45_8]HCI49160.1 type VI secretion system baseplate subunit TssG [Holosporales bacterium]
MENMARTRRRTDTPLKKRSLIGLLSQEADQFEFHALVKILECLNPEATPLGEGHHPHTESIRIKTHLEFGFQTTDVVGVEEIESPQPIIKTNFLNLAGIQGPLPTPYTQMVMDRDRQKDTALHSFLDIFNHRLISLLHRIRKKYWVGVAANPPEDTFMGRMLRSILGLGVVNKKDRRLQVLNRSLLFYTGLIWQQRRSVVALEKLLRNYFNVPVKIDQFQGAWVKVPLDQQTKIGDDGQFNRLGETAILGDRFWEQQQSIKIHVGPLGIKGYINFLKPGKAYSALKILVAFFCGEDQDFHLNLILKKEEVPLVKLGQGIALHWTSWLNRKSTEWTKDDHQNTMNKKAFKIL